MTVLAVTPERWDDLQALFGPNGAYSGCWCMWFRQTAKEFEQCAGGANRGLMEQLVRAGDEPGLIAYEEGEPVGWVTVAPRERFGRIERSPTIGPVDEEAGVWAIPCFFVRRDRRGQGIARTLLSAAVDYAREHGARFVEGYPLVAGERIQAANVYVGTISMFASLGFTEVARRSKRQCVMRLPVDDAPM